MRDELSALAGRVLRLGLEGRLGPERALLEREAIAEELRRLARQAERAAPPRPAQAAPPPPGRGPGQARQAAVLVPDVQLRRVSALLRERERELALARALLRQARRRNAPRDARASGRTGQLYLPGWAEACPRPRAGGGGAQPYRESKGGQR